jgi:hypothetical protein
VSKTVAIFAIFLLVLAQRAAAQMKVGETSLNLNGTLSAGYANDTSNVFGSQHSIVGGGTVDLFGSYYDPNFFSFDIQPFYNQSRDNSASESLTSASGVNLNTRIFGGSHYPGSISYSTSLNSSGNYNVPGLGNYTTHGNNDTLAITWGVHPDDLPSLNFSFSNANNAYSIYGANANGTLHADTFSVTSGYRIEGFNLNGGYQHTDAQALTPEFLTGEPAQNSTSGANAFSFGIGHKLPWNGTFYAAATRLDLNTDLDDVTYRYRYNTTIDTVTGGLNFNPRAHLSVGATTFYTDNLEGTLYNTLITSGVTVPQNEGQQSSNDLSLSAYADYEMPAEHMNLHGFVERQQQSFLGLSFAADSLNGQATYSNKVLGGSFNGVVGVTRTSLDTTHESLVGLNTAVNYTHRIEQWILAGGFGYSQDAQTVLIAYTSSGYTYNGSVGRRVRRRSYWGVYVSGARSLLTDQPGSANASHSYSTTLSLARLSFTGSYSDSSGNALLTSTGLVATPVPLPIVNPAAVVLYNGKAYSAGVGAHPTRALTLSASYAKAISDTRSVVTSSKNNNENLNCVLTYNFRKLAFNTGYSRLVQGFSLSGTSPTMVASFYVGFSRWFNFF